MQDLQWVNFIGKNLCYIFKVLPIFLNDKRRFKKFHPLSKHAPKHNELIIKYALKEGSNLWFHPSLEELYATL
jgi:hypothetical protein